MKRSLEDLSKEVADFVDERDWGQFHSPRNLAMALSVEANELLELYLWCKDDAPQPIHPSRGVEDEAADVFICLLNFCRRAEIDLAQALSAKLVKAKQKYPVDRVRGSALKYNEYPDYCGEE